MSGLAGLMGGGIGGICHITQQGYDQAFGGFPPRSLDARLRAQLDGQRSAQRDFPGILQLHEAEYQRQQLQQMIGQPYPLGSWAGNIEREVRKHFPSKAYECFVQRNEGRDSYMCRITRQKALVAQVDVPCELLRYPNRGEWRVELLAELSNDIEARAR